MLLIHESLDLHLSLSNTVCFVPMNFGCSDLSILQLDFSDAFHLSPPAWSELLFQSIDVSYSRTNCNRFNILKFSDNLEICLKTASLFAHADKALDREVILSSEAICRPSLPIAQG